MPLKVIGAGFGRTGTLSLKNALEKLGFGPCYHMMEVFERPEHVAAWHRLAFEGTMDWGMLFKDFNAAVDWPACRFWRELAEYYPEGKVLLSVRDPETWWNSVRETIYHAMTIPPPENASASRKLQFEMTRKLILEDTFNGRFEDQAYAIDVYQRHIQEVRAGVDPERLLVFDVKEGWGPLCRFLNVPEPDEPFPRLNDRATIQAMIKERFGAGSGGARN